MDPHRPEQERQIRWPDGRIMICRDAPHEMNWRPDRPGRDFDEALAWAATQMRGLRLEDLSGGGTLWQCRWWDSRESSIAEDHRTAICRAIVAWERR